MKIAVSGKGGVGKTTMAALLAHSFAGHGRSVIAIDADPDANFAVALGFPADVEVTPLVEMRDLIRERTGAEPGQSGALYKMNPKVDDIPERFAMAKGNIRFLAMGTVRRGGNGCACPEHTMLRQLLNHLLIQRNEVLIMDMEAGIEHLGRGTAQFVDVLLVVMEPGSASISTYQRIRKLAADLAIKRIVPVANRIRGDEDIRRIEDQCETKLWCALPYDQELSDYNLPRSKDSIVDAKIKKLREKIEEELNHGR